MTPEHAAKELYAYIIQNYPYWFTVGVGVKEGSVNSTPCLYIYYDKRYKITPGKIRETFNGFKIYWKPVSKMEIDS
jgi:hypothetical protein